jgi:hypothetical protein
LPPDKGEVDREDYPGLLFVDGKEVSMPMAVVASP